MTHEHWLDFLSQHQPMPDHPNPELMALYKEATSWFYNNPNKKCIPLFLTSFGDWEDLHVYESVQSVLSRFQPEDVIPHLKSGLQNDNETIRFWCCDTVRIFPDDSLVAYISPILESENSIVRYVAAAALEAIGSTYAKTVAAHYLLSETDEQVRDSLLNV